MRIISKFKDYYDNAMAYGQDKSVVFVRNDVLIKDKQILSTLDKVLPKIILPTKTYKNITITFDTIIVVFCGKLYRGITCTRQTTIPKKDVALDACEIEIKTFYNYNEMVEWLNFYHIELAQLNSFWHKRLLEKYDAEEYLKNQGTLELYDLCIANSYVTLSYNVDKNRGILKNDYYVWSMNSHLSSLQFFKIFDAFSAYQELDMFISGTLPQSTMMPIEIADKHRIEQHGFDKWSFRKMPE